MGEDGRTARPSSALDPAFFELIADHVAHPIFVKDRSFRFVFINDAFTKMLGFPREELLGKSDYDFFPEAEADFFRAKDVEMFASGRKVVIDEEPITDAEGGHHVLATTKVPLVDATGTITHLVGIIHDITRLKAAEEVLRRSNAELEERVRERTRELTAAQEDLVRKERLAVLGSLAGGVAHQIRNPLASIKTAAHVLRDLTSGAEEAVSHGADERDADVASAERFGERGVVVEVEDLRARILAERALVARLRTHVEHELVSARRRLGNEDPSCSACSPSNENPHGAQA